MCKVLKVNRSAYYHWVNNGCITNKVDERLNKLIKNIFYQYREVYGTRRIKKVLVQEYGVIVLTRKIVLNYLFWTHFSAQETSKWSGGYG